MLILALLWQKVPYDDIHFRHRSWNKPWILSAWHKFHQSLAMALGSIHLLPLSVLYLPLVTGLFMSVIYTESFLRWFPGSVLFGTITIGLTQGETLYVITPTFSSVSNSFCAQSTCFNGRFISSLTNWWAVSSFNFHCYKWSFSYV